MVYLVKNGDLRNLLPLLEANLPYSLPVNCVLKLMIDGRLTDSFNAWVDNLECPSAVVISPKKDTCKNPCYRRIVLAYGSDGNDLTTMFNQKGVIDTTEETVLFGFPDYIAQKLQGTIPLGQMKMNRRHETKIFQITSPDEILKTSLPEGFSVGYVTPDLCNRISSQWKYSRQGFEDMLKDAALWGLPSVCIFNHDNEPVAWVMQKQFGFIGYLHVMEEYRGRGLAKFALSEISSKLIKQNQSVYVDIELDNPISFQLHESVGFRNNCKDTFNYCQFLPQ